MSSQSIPARSARTRLILLIALLVVMAVPVVWIWARPNTQPDAAEGEAVAADFLSRLREGKPELAWESTTAEFKSARGKDSFVSFVKPEMFLKEPLEFVSTQTVVVQDQPHSEFVFRSASGPRVRIVVGREGGEWKVARWNLEK